LPVSRLTQFQREVLREFFIREQRFFLTGGGALAAFYLGHRETDDLDFFTAIDALDEGRRVLQDVVDALGATLETITDSPAHKRFIVHRQSESLKIDLVYDAHQLLPKLMAEDGVRVDSAEEILANKLTTLLSRSEIRDLVDLRALEATGISLEEALPRAMQKDGGLTAGQLVRVLSEIRIGDDAEIPGGVTAVELRFYLKNLIDRLARLAYPR
jgi:predicted nucleotidyltransferase component of viral defense system